MSSEKYVSVAYLVTGDIVRQEIEFTDSTPIELLTLNESLLSSIN